MVVAAPSGALKQLNLREQKNKRLLSRSWAVLQTPPVNSALSLSIFFRSATPLQARFPQCYSVASSFSQSVQDVANTTYALICVMAVCTLVICIHCRGITNVNPHYIPVHPLLANAGHSPHIIDKLRLDTPAITGASITTVLPGLHAKIGAKRWG